ncbi:MAG: protein tyrosine phosphatase family protein [Pseudomonadota bacterium]
MAACTSTLRTAVKFLREVFRHRISSGGSARTLGDIYNYHPVPGLFSTSGQPSEQQFALIKAAGVRTVINLAPNSVLENALVDERRILDHSGVDYVHIPVDFQNPTQRDFEEFCAQIERVDHATLWVHCAANMRVSAFVFRYRTERLGVDSDVAMQDLHKIWRPFGVWREFLNL